MANGKPGRPRKNPIATPVEAKTAPEAISAATDTICTGCDATADCAECTPTADAPDKTLYAITPVRNVQFVRSGIIFPAGVEVVLTEADMTLAILTDPSLCVRELTPEEAAGFEPAEDLEA